MRGRHAAARPSRRAPVGRGRPRDRRRLRPRRRADTRTGASRSRPTLVAINVDPADAAKNYRVDVVLDGDAATAARALAGAVAGARRWTTSRRACAGVRARGVRARSTRRALRFLDAISLRAARRRRAWSCDMCIPGYWLAGFHARAGARAGSQYPMGWGTLGFAFPAALGAALAGDGPDGRGLRRRRLPVRLRRARDDGAGAASR